MYIVNGYTMYELNIYANYFLNFIKLLFIHSIYTHETEKAFFVIMHVTLFPSATEYPLWYDNSLDAFCFLFFCKLETEKQSTINIVSFLFIFIFHFCFPARFASGNSIPFFHVSHFILLLLHVFQFQFLKALSILISKEKHFL